MKTGIRKTGEIKLLDTLANVENMAHFSMGILHTLTGSGIVLLENNEEQELHLEISSIWSPEESPLSFHDYGQSVESIQNPTDEPELDDTINDLLYSGVMNIVNGLFENAWTIFGFAIIEEQNPMSITMIYLADYGICKYYINTQEDVFVPQITRAN